MGQYETKDVILTIHLRGVYESKISLLHTTGNYTLKPLITKQGIKNGETTDLTIPLDVLPGEFVLRFDYKEKESSTPYPSEKRIIIGNQDIELWVHPIYSNNTDSTWFHKGEKENTEFAHFMKENNAQKEMLGLLQNFLLNYDDNSSGFYRQGIDEYEKRREMHNKWINEQISINKELFAATLFSFQLVQEVDWTGDEEDRKQSFIDHYFDLINFNDSLLVNAIDFKSWVDQYVNIFGERATSIELRDSLFTRAGENAIEKSKKGHPKVYGWMVDYFFNGYESFNIQSGIAMLGKYIDDPNCLTLKRQAILKRIEGFKTLVIGSQAPDFSLNDPNGQNVNFYDYKTNCPFKLVLFWSADCPHCVELVNKLYAWHQQSANQRRIEIFDISLDDTDTEIAEWHKFISQLHGWKHIRAEGGVNSTQANSYFIIATPVMIVVDSETNNIAGLPGNIAELENILKDSK